MSYWYLLQDNIVYRVVTVKHIREVLHHSVELVGCVGKLVDTILCKK